MKRKFIASKELVDRLDSYDDYLEIQKEFMKAHYVGKETLNGAELLLIDMVECVDFARNYYIERNLK